MQGDFYIDLFNTGGSAIDEARELQTQLIEPLKEGGFNLRKWKANSEHILTQLLNLKTHAMFDHKISTSKTFGLW